MKIVIDKLAIGLLLLLSGLLVNKSIEKFKHEEALKNEFEKQRFAARLGRLERQLSEFYWPVYLRLQKDNTVWRRILDKNRDDDDPRKRIGAKIETDFIIPNHKETVAIIESRMHLAEPDEELQGFLLEYMDHVAVYLAATAAGFTDLHNTQKDLLTEWPEGLFPAIERRTHELQTIYDELLVRYQQAYNPADPTEPPAPAKLPGSVRLADPVELSKLAEHPNPAGQPELKGEGEANDTVGESARSDEDPESNRHAS